MFEGAAYEKRAVETDTQRHKKSTHIHKREREWVNKREQEKSKELSRWTDKSNGNI